MIAISAKDENRDELRDKATCVCIFQTLVAQLLSSVDGPRSPYLRDPRLRRTVNTAASLTSLIPTSEKKPFSSDSP